MQILSYKKTVNNNSKCRSNIRPSGPILKGEVLKMLTVLSWFHIQVSLKISSKSTYIIVRLTLFTGRQTDSKHSIISSSVRDNKVSLARYYIEASVTISVRRWSFGDVIKESLLLTVLRHFQMTIFMIISYIAVALFLIFFSSSSSSFELKTALIPFSPTTTGRLRNTS